MIANSESAYSQRVKTIKNDGEYLFEKFCQENNCQYQRLGFDEHQASVPNYWRLNSIIRNLPDFVINIGNKTFVVAVKGTDKFKKKEIDLLPSMINAYSSKEAPLIYAFCFKENSGPIWVKPSKIIELYNNAHDEQWHDKVVFRDLKIRNKK